MITLRKAMRILDADECYTIATDDGNGWLFYFNGEMMLLGTTIPLKEVLDREVVNIYERDERKYWSESERKFVNFIELEKGLAFIVKGNENGSI